MNTIAKTAFVTALLLSAAPALAEDAHHPATTEAPAASSAPGTATPVPGDSDPAGGSDPAMSSSMMGGGMMGDDMMKMMREMMDRHAGMMRGMMPGAMGIQGGMMGQMMAPEHVEGRIAFLRAELKVTDAQRPLWEAVAEAMRADAGTAADGMPSGMPAGPDGSTAPQKLQAQETALSARRRILAPAQGCPGTLLCLPRCSTEGKGGQAARPGADGNDVSFGLA